MRILFVGGGTLGSVTSLLAVAEELRGSSDYRLPTTDYCFWGTRTGPERVLVEAAGIPFHAIPSGKLRRYFDVRNVTDIFVMEWAFWVSLTRLLRDRPSVVVGAGSFVQVPVMWAAWFLRIPIVIHQLDVRLSLANRLCAPLARAVTATFAESAEALGAKVLVIGSPVRRAVLALARRSLGEGGTRARDPREAKRTFGFSGDQPALLVLGGGTGAQALNELVAGALSQLTAVADVIHVTGRGKSSERPASCVPRPAAYRAFDLLTDRLPDALAAADLVVSRAGMGTIAELGALGKAAVLIPMPDTHQEENAHLLADRGAALMWNQRDLTPSVFAERVTMLLRDAATRDRLSRAISAVFPQDAATKFAEIVRHIAGRVNARKV